MKIRDLIVKFKISFVIKEIDAAFYIIEEEKNNYDTIYFGFIEIPKYRGWHYFTKSQIDYISKYFKTKKEIKKINIVKTLGEKKLKGLPVSFKKVQEEKIYFNSSMFFTFFNKEFSERIKNGSSYCYKQYHFSQSRFLTTLKKHPTINEIFSDKREVIFQEKTFFNPHRSLANVEVRERELDFINKFNSKKEMINSLIPAGLRDKKLLFNYINDHLLHQKNNQYERVCSINSKLLGTCLLIKKLAQDQTFSFSLYKKLVHAFYRRPACFKYEVMAPNRMVERKESFVKLVKNLSGEDLKKNLKIIKNWKFYSDTSSDILANLEIIKEKYPLEIQRHKDPFWAYNFYSKKYTEKSFPNFEFKQTLNPATIGKIKINPVKSLKDLISIGVKLHNCAGNIETLSYYKNSLIFTVEVDGKTYLGSVRGRKLAQLKGWKNSSPSREVFDITQNYLLKNEYTRISSSFKDSCIQTY